MAKKDTGKNFKILKHRTYTIIELTLCVYAQVCTD